MARRGFFSRFSPAKLLRSLSSTIERVITGETGKEPRQPVPKPSKREADPFAQIWMEERLSRPGRDYRAHRNLFMSLPGIVEENRDEQIDLWRDYLRLIDLRGDHRREFQNKFGVNLKRNFDWEEWRAVQKPGDTPIGRRAA